MTLSATTAAVALSRALPADPNARLAVFAFRRMGAYGLHDAAAAQAVMQRFGQSFRRPLLLLRAMMADLAATSTCPISIAPCCCQRMTFAEESLLTVLARAEHAPESARLLLADLLGARRVDGMLASVSAVAQAFADSGRPIVV